MELFFLEPPAFRLKPIWHVPDPTMGGVLFGRITASETRSHEVLSHLATVRAAAPWAPLLIYLPMDDCDVVSHIGKVQSATGARAISPVPTPDLEVLRACLVDPAFWRRDLPAWASIALPDLPIAARGVLNAVLLGARIPELKVGIRPSVRKVNEHVRVAGVGPHRRVSAVLRLVSALHLLWENPDRTVLEAALGAPFPYADATSFSNQCMAVLGCRPSRTRIGLVWEWLMWGKLVRSSTY